MDYSFISFASCKLVCYLANEIIRRVSNYVYLIPSISGFLRNSICIHLMFVDPFINSIIHTENPTRCNSVSKFFFHIYIKLNMFRATQRPSSGA